MADNVLECGDPPCRVCWECLWNMSDEEEGEMIEALSIRYNVELMLCDATGEESPEHLGEFCCDPGEDVTDRINDVLLQAGFHRRVLTEKAPRLWFVSEDDEYDEYRELEFDRSEFYQQDIEIGVGYFNSGDK